MKGGGLVDTVKTLLHQDYASPIIIRLLIENEKDTSFLPLVQHFKADIKGKEGSSFLLFSATQREVWIDFTGFTAKREKINWALPNLTTPLVAFLDADHRAAPDWIQTSVAILESEGSDAVQSRRMPLSVNKIMQVWDSVQNHIGNELLNSVFKKMKASVFFTGTTCVFRSEIFKSIQFPDCITEDTYLSYSLLVKGKKISYNPRIGSYEEVAPDLRSYIARRRRWSSGHTRSWWEHFLKIVRADLSFGNKAQLMIHGQFYLVPIFVVVLFDVSGLYLFLQLALRTQLAVLVVTAGFAFSVCWLLTRQYKNLLIDTLFSFLWIFPQIVFAAVFLYSALSLEIYYFLLSFPYASDLAIFHALLIFMPLLSVTVGYLRFRNIRWVQFLYIFPSYPLILFLDIYSEFLGFADFIFKKNVWSKIRRDETILMDALPEHMRNMLGQAQFKKFKTTAYVIGPLVLLMLITVNELLAYDNCGETVPLLWQPWFVHVRKPLSMDLDVVTVPMDTEEFRVEIKGTFENREQKPYKISYLIDGKVLRRENFDKAHFTFKDQVKERYGWKRRKIEVLVQGADLSCRRSHFFSTAVKEFRGQNLFINQEPFIIKGIIPSFSNASIDLPMLQGLQQIKNAGANTVRFYHKPSRGTAEVASELNLMLIDQPDNSTWENIKISNPYEKASLVDRYISLSYEYEGFPFTLFHNAGNELEMHVKDKRQFLQDFNDFSSTVHSKLKDAHVGYSTYNTYLNFGSDILGINMLDSGDTYWDDALPIVQSFHKPFYASEFGGFVAYYEDPSAPLRVIRMLEQWPRLLSLGAMGAVFFESHDNWAQPVPHSYNDPFTPDKPDDLRGYWDHDNKPKPELRFLENIFSDLRVRYVPTEPLKLPQTIKIHLENIRPYSLNALELTSGDLPSVSIGTLEVGQSRTLDLPLSMNVKSDLRLVAKYTTHHGFKQSSVIHLRLPIEDDVPVILNDDFINTKGSEFPADGFVVSSDKLKMIVPKNMMQFKLFDERHFERRDGIMEIPIFRSQTRVSLFQVSADAKKWLPFDPTRVANGFFHFRFSNPKENIPQASLVLTGTGTDDVVFWDDKQHPVHITCHPYRDCVIELKRIPFKSDGFVYFDLDRNQTSYLSVEDDPARKGVAIKLEYPKFFAPYYVEVRKL